MVMVPTGRMETELRKLYVSWVRKLPDHEADLTEYLAKFQRESTDLVNRMGGDIARLGVSAGFPAPKELDLALRAGTIYSDMQVAAVRAGIATGLNSRTAARQLFRAGVESSYKRLERLARTETVRAYWQNQRAEAADLGLVLVWVSEDGPRTCDWCRERDGLVADDGCYDHPNGRCTLAPMLPSRVKYKGSVSADGSIYHDPEWESKYQPVTGLNDELAAPPVLTAEEADVWARDSVFQQEFLHGTSPEAAVSIRSEGFKLDDTVFGRNYGNGVYLTEDPATAFQYAKGETLRTRVNVTNPIDLDDIWTDPRIFDILDEITDKDYAAEVFARRYGYDAIVKRGPGGVIDELIVMDPDKVRVVTSGVKSKVSMAPSKPPRVVDMDNSTKTYQRLVDQSIERRGDFRFMLDDGARSEALLQNWYESEQAVKRVASNLKRGIDPFDGLDGIDGWQGFVDHYTGVPKGLDKIAGGKTYVFTEDDILDHVRSAAEWLNKQPPQPVAAVTRPKYDTLRGSAGTDLPGLYKGLSIDPDVDLNSLFKVGNQFDLNASSFTSSGGTASSYAKNYRVIDDSLPAMGSNNAPMQGVFFNLEDGVGVPLTKNASFGGDLQKANEWLVSGKAEVVRIDETLNRMVVVIRMVP